MRTLQTVDDGLGGRVDIPFPVQRIVTLAPGVTEIVAEAGGLDRIVGVSNADDYPPAVVELPNFSALPVNFEAVIALKPDVVFAALQVNNRRDADHFRNLDIPIVFLPSSTLDETLLSIEEAGRIIGSGHEAEAAVAELRRRIERLGAASSENEIRSRVLFLISSTSLHAFGRHSYIHDLIDLAGGISITSEIEVENPILSDEFVLTKNPDVIVGTFGNAFTTSSLLEAHPTWGAISAVQNRRVFTIDPDIVLRAGPRIVDGAEKLFSLLHGETDTGSRP